MSLSQILSFLLLFSTLSSFAQLRQNKPRKFYLQNIIYEKKQIPVLNHKVQLQLDESKMPGEHLSRLNNIECRFDSVAGDSLVMTLMSEEIDIEFRNKFIDQSTTYYPGSSNKVHKTVALKDIMYLNGKNPFRQKVTEIGSVLMGLSILTIVASPLAGLELKGEARAARRSEVFSIGVAGFIVSIPFFIVGKNKKYGISPLFRTKRNNYWVLKEKP